MNYTLHHGNCLEVLRTLADNSIDSIVTDPPYGLRFMGKRWDYDVPGVEVWRECLRVLKPGGHLLSFGGSRTYHRMAVAIEDAGFEIRDQIMWVYGSGFPKSLDVSKAIDAMHGAEREVVGTNPNSRPNMVGVPAMVLQRRADAPITAPATPDAERWDGWGTALKPAHEPICMARKPLAGTVAANVLEWGTGAINVDGCRVGTEEITYQSTKVVGAGRERSANVFDAGDGKTPDGRNLSAVLQRQQRYAENRYETTVSGRWPANFIHDGSEEVTALFPGNTGAQGGKDDRGRTHVAFSMDTPRRETRKDVWGEPRDGLGSAARFFYCAKASPGERDAGLEALPKVGNNRYGEFAGTDTHAPKNGSHNFSRNHHPTVKPIALMRYLVRLITPPGGVVLDPFCGSGSTGCGAALEGLRFVGIEREAEYVKIARRRIAYWAASVELPLLALAAD